MPKNSPDGTLVDTFVVDEPVRTSQKRSKVSMLASDAILLAVEHIQIYALILSLSLAWPWSYDWIRVNSIVFFFNLDFWEFAKVHTVYGSQTQAYEDPSNVPFNYLTYTIIWLLVALLMPLIFVVIFLVIRKVPTYGPLQVILFRAKLTRAFLFIAQILVIPFGLTTVRLVDCQIYIDTLTGEQQFRSIVLKDTQCWSATHLGIMVPLLIVALIYVVALPLGMIFIIQKELIAPLYCMCVSQQTHERMILLKEAEFVQGIDLTWATNHYSLFSSFHRRWAWFRALSFFVKVLIICIYGGLFYQQIIQTILLFALFVILLLTVIILPVYRINIFNLMLTFSIFVNICNITLGMLLSLGVQNALLFGQNLINSLLVVNVAWDVVAAGWFSYIYLRSQKIIGTKLGSLWPVLSELDSTNPFRSKHTEKFFKALLSGRRILEQCYSTTEFFAPVHELSRQIQIINAYCREAEVLEDPAHSSLWALLAEMVDAHSSIAPHSIYGTSVKGNVPHKIHQLMELIPALRKRLEQREYDFILWTPTKQRILLKLVAVSTFLRRNNNRIRIPIETSYPHLRSGHANSLSFLSDDCEGCNDRFLVDIEKWEEMRKKSLLPMEDNRFPSIGSLQTDDRTCEVELWEDHAYFTGGHREWNSCSVQSSTSVDRLLDDVEDWQTLQLKQLGADQSVKKKFNSTSRDYMKKEGSSSLTDIDGEGAVPSSLILTGRKNARSAGSCFNARFTLMDTIDEQEGQSPSRTSSAMNSIESSIFNSADNLISGVEENFPQD